MSSARNQPRVSRWKSREARLARSCSSCGSAASSFEPRGRELAAEAELGRRPGHAGREERLRLVGGQPGEPRAIAAREPVAAGGPAHGVDRDARRGERLHVAVDRPHRDLEPLGDLGRGQLPARLEQEQQRDEPRRAHFLNHDRRCPLCLPESRMNIWDDEWGEQHEDWSGGGAQSPAARPQRAVPRRDGSTSSSRGNFMIYHAHHGSDELLSCCAGRPTLRTPAGERPLDEGEVVHFPPGPEGVHEIRNDTAAPVRYVIAGTRVSPEVVEYPDLKQVTAQSKPHGSLPDPRREGGGSMSERDSRISGRRHRSLELLLREPEILAWLDDRPAGRSPTRCPTTTRRALHDAARSERRYEPGEWDDYGPAPDGLVHAGAPARPGAGQLADDERLRARPGREAPALPLPPRGGGGAARARGDADAPHADGDAGARAAATSCTSRRAPRARTSCGTTATRRRASSSRRRNTTPEVVEYPDIEARSPRWRRRRRKAGPGLWTMHFLECGVGYWDGQDT